jgi:hypothetical protein
MAAAARRIPVFPRIARTPFDDFREELAVAERAASSSRLDWDVREADLERRLAALHLRASSLPKRSIPKLPRRDPVALYSSRWSQSARMSVLLAK